MRKIITPKKNHILIPEEELSFISLFIYFCVMNEIKLHIYSADTDTILALPYANEGIRAGFPSPAQDYMTESIDLNKELIHNKETTFYARVEGDSMIDAGIYNGDYVVIDKSLEANDGDYIAAYVDGEFTLKQFKRDPKNNCAWLIPHNPEYKPIKVTEENDFIVWGVVTNIIRKLKK